MMILYLHGFRSSPASFKSTVMRHYLQQIGRIDEFFCPQLPASPQAAIDLACDLVRQYAERTNNYQINIIGSSLGGFYATYLCENLSRILNQPFNKPFTCRAVLLNPAVKPPHDLQKYVGISTQFHSDAPFEFKAAYIDQLQALSVAHITEPKRYFLIAATGDEVLDWRDMTAFYADARQYIIDGSNHGIDEFAAYAPQVMAFIDGVGEH